MYAVAAPAVYITERVRCDPRGVARMERMMAHVKADAVRHVTDDELNDIIREHALTPRGRAGQNVRGNDRVIVFNAFTWDSDEVLAQRRQRYPHLESHLLLGHNAWTWRDRTHLREHCHGVCQSAHELHCASGCLHGCRYCHIGNLLVVMVNLEEYVEHLDGLLRSEPWLKLFKYDNQTDQICFEPEYGASDIMVRYFARQTDRYLLLYTKSDNVDHLLDLPHAGHTIVNWSLSCDAVSRDLETNTPDIHQRIEAAEKCQRAGYTVRARFSPIVPIADWREQYGATVREYLARVSPDVITLDVVGWMSATAFCECVDVATLDPPFRRYIEDLVRQGDPDRGKPYAPAGKQLFSHELRADIYRFLIDETRRRRPDQRISICMETPEMWQVYGAELGMGPDDYVCCCGPTSVPTHPLLRPRAVDGA